LVYDNLKQAKKLPEQQKMQFEAQQQQLRQQHTSTLVMFMGTTFIIVGAILPIYQDSWWPSGCFDLLGVACWVFALTKKRN
jgi:ubiquinone biosynthesis protein